jgi:phosphotransferase system  glucose/maltose/N-acetylglucosamine-specific IIC component
MPEFIIISNSFIKSFVLPFSGQIDFLITSMYDSENTLNPVVILPHILFFYFFVFYFIYIFFSYYSSSTREESLIDHDFLIANVTVESEEEIGAIDDILIGSVLLVFLFF